MSAPNPKLFEARANNDFEGMCTLSTEITLRDLFAMVALSGMFAHTGPPRDTREMAAMAPAMYAIADKMLAERAEAPR